VLDTGTLWFWLLAFITIASAVMVVFLKNIVHSALYMMLSLAGVAGTYLLLNAEFLAAVQILIYVGAIAILIVFAVMLTRRGGIQHSNPFSGKCVFALIVTFALFVVIFKIITPTAWVAVPGQAAANNVTAIADAFLVNFVVPFEVAAVLLLVAMVGAILLARGVKVDQ
jgi:NADH:ubiquinone oxidoreductase subunit 6 (subunit J)